MFILELYIGSLGWNGETQKGLRELYAVPTYTRMIRRANYSSDIGSELIHGATTLQNGFDERNNKLVGNLARVNLALEENPNDSNKKREKTILEGELAEARMEFDKSIEKLVAKRSPQLNGLNFGLSQGREGIARSDTAAGSSAGEYAQRLDSIIGGAQSMHLHPDVRQKILSAVSSNFQRHAVNEQGGVAAQEH